MAKTLSNAGRPHHDGRLPPISADNSARRAAREHRLTRAILRRGDFIDGSGGRRGL
jgi:hypothetical protein